jgi:hypothetical protein
MPLAASKIAAILKAHIGSTAFPIYRRDLRSGAAELCLVPFCTVI